MSNIQSQISNKNIIVSIVCITYNHEPYLHDALEGFLMQKTTFPFEIILAEDCSTDGTRSICEVYAEKYPDTIRYIWSENNVGAVENEARALRSAKGKYIALCEGDDYWTDPLKLQKQVDFMEAHPEYSVTFHRYKIHYEDADVWKDDYAEKLFIGSEMNGVDITIEQSLNVWLTQYLTAVFRKDCYDYTWADRYKWYRDSHMFYHLMTRGKAYLFAFKGGVYRRTGDGIYTNMDQYHMQLRTIEVCREMWKKNDDERLKVPYVKALQYFVDSFYKEPTFRKDMFHASNSLYALTGQVKQYIKNICKILR